jgi:hypothetical protein
MLLGVEMFWIGVFVGVIIGFHFKPQIQLLMDLVRKEVERR